MEENDLNSEGQVVIKDVLAESFHTHLWNI
jgi:hypothetical protein